MNTPKLIAALFAVSAAIAVPAVAVSPASSAPTNGQQRAMPAATADPCPVGSC